MVKFLLSESLVLRRVWDSGKTFQRVWRIATTPYGVKIIRGPSPTGVCKNIPLTAQWLRKLQGKVGSQNPRKLSFL